MKITKFVSALVMLVVLLGFNVTASAEVQTITAVGRYIVGDGPEENLLVARLRAKEDAKRRASEMAGIFVKSYSKIVNLTLVEDEVTTIASKVMRVIEEDVTYGNTSDGLALIINCKLTAEVDTSNIMFEGKEKADLALAVTPIAKEEKQDVSIINNNSGMLEKSLSYERYEPNANPETVVINASVSVKSQEIEENELKERLFIDKPADFVGDNVTKMLEGKSVRLLPDPKHWECIGNHMMPMLRNGQVVRHVKCILWIAPESVVQHGNRLRYQGVVYQPEKGFYRISNYMIDYTKKYQVMLDGEQFSPYDGRFLKESTSFARGDKISFAEKGARKTVLNHEFMRKYLK